MNVLITGASGAGKSSLARFLQSKGYLAYDTDALKDLSAWVDRKTGKPDPAYKDGPPEDWVDKYDWMWDKKELQKLLDKAGGKTAYFCGGSANQDELYSLFDKVVLLEVDDELIVKRLTKSEREHEFGNRPGELEIILGWYKDFQLRAKKAGAITIYASKPLNEVAQEVIKATG